MGRRTKTLVPTTNQLLYPRIIEPKVVEEQLKQKRTRQKYYYDKHSKSLPELNIGDCVRIQSDGKWRPATVTSIPSAPRSYVVTTPEGQTYRRNRRHISKAKTHAQWENNYLLDDEDDDGTGEKNNSTDVTSTPNPTPDTSVDSETPDSTPIVDLAPGGEPLVANPPTPLRRSNRKSNKPSRYDDTWSLHT